MLKKDADQSNVSIGAETEYIHFGFFRKLSIGILNISKCLASVYQVFIQKGKKKTKPAKTSQG